MTFIDLFSGIGGFRIGMEMAGHICKGHCENDKFANYSYSAMHLLNDEEKQQLLKMDLKSAQKYIKDYKKEWFSDDITGIRAVDIPNVDVWCFGFPCQDISVAGKGTGMAGERSGLFYKVTALVQSKEEKDKPTYLFIENVKNLISINGGWDFARVLAELDEIGYDAEWQVLNSKNYGVPQNRERVFIIGHLRGRCTTKVFPINRADEKACVPVTILAHRKSYRRNSQVYDPNGITEAIDTGTGGGRVFSTINIIGSTANPNAKGTNSRGWVHSSIGIVGTISATVHKQPKKVAIPVLTPSRKNKRQNGRRFKLADEPMFTLTSQDRHGVAIREATKQGYSMAYDGDGINLEQPNSKTRRGRVGKGIANTLTCGNNHGTLQNLQIRQLTPREYFRLQGFNDEYFDLANAVNSDSQLYKQAGNAVTVNVIFEIARRLKLEGI